MTHQRIQYIDCMRGSAMIMVIFCHIEIICFNSVYDNLFRIFSSIMVPLFFFVSAFFTPPALSYKDIVKRIRWVLIPTILMMILYIGYSIGGFNDIEKCLKCMKTNYKWGYWFPIVLVEMNILHYLYSKISYLIAKEINTIIVFVVMVFIFSIYIKNSNILNLDYNEIIEWLSLDYLVNVFPFYAFGLLFAKYKTFFTRWLDNKYIITALIIVYCVLIILTGGGYKKYLICGCFGIMVVYHFFCYYKDYFSSDTYVGRKLLYVGQNTLPIYFIHYFFLNGLEMPWVKNYLNPETQGWYISIITLSLTVIVLYASAITIKIIKLSPILYQLLLGKRLYNDAY